jgi:hypothetical protein
MRRVFLIENPAHGGVSVVLITIFPAWIAGSNLGRILNAGWNSKGAFEAAESVGLSCILYAIVAGTIKVQRNLTRRIQGHKILKKSLPDLEGHQSHVYFGPFC